MYFSTKNPISSPPTVEQNESQKHTHTHRRHTVLVYSAWNRNWLALFPESRTNCWCLWLKNVKVECWLQCEISKEDTSSRDVQFCIVHVHTYSACSKVRRQTEFSFAPYPASLNLSSNLGDLLEPCAPIKYQTTIMPANMLNDYTSKIVLHLCSLMTCINSVIFFDLTVGSVSGSGCSSRRSGGGRWRTASSPDSRRRKWRESRKRCWMYSSSASYLRCHDTSHRQPGYRSKRTTKTTARQQYTISIPRSWSQSNVRGE